MAFEIILNISNFTNTSMMFAYSVIFAYLTVIVLRAVPTDWNLDMNTISRFPSSVSFDTRVFS